MEEMKPEDGQLVGLGTEHEVTPDRQRSAMTEFNIRYSTALEHHNHLWVVTVTHFASDQMIRAFTGQGEPGEMPILDHETIAMPPGIGCFICEQTYDPNIAWRKCKGEPR